jgi:hypothetical protein
MIRQSTVGKGRGRGKGKGKGKGKRSVGQRSKVVITNEVNLSESSSESSGDELIANLVCDSADVTLALVVCPLLFCVVPVTIACEIASVALFVFLVVLLDLLIACG